MVKTVKNSTMKDSNTRKERQRQVTHDQRVKER